MSEVRVPDALVHQEAADRSLARFKLVRWGRRTGKTTWAFKAAMVGHGLPVDGVFPLEGVYHGKHVYWIPPDYKQAGTLWHSEVLPRLGNVAGVKLNNTEHDAWFPNGGALLMRSAENIGAVRGAGKLLGGIVLEEAGRWALEDGWKNELRPTLMDNKAWAIFIGTTNRGSDGSRDEEGNLVLPSFFNRLCQRQRDGQLDDDWAQFYGTARDNPKIRLDEFEKLSGEYDPFSVAFRQEILAELLAGAEGVVFKEWRADLHVLKSAWEVPGNWVWGCGLDFGYRKPGCFILFACSSDGDVVAVDELYFRELHAEEAGFRVGTLMARFPCFPSQVSFDEAMKQNTGLGVTQAESFQAGLRRALGDRAPWMVPQSHGPGSRVAGVQLLHRYLAWQEGEMGEIPPWGQPRLKIHPRCVNLIRTLPILPYATSRVGGDSEDVDSSSDDHCLAPDTPILTDRGWLPIAVLDGVRISRYDAEVLTVRDRWGFSLTCTPDHRILTPEGWVEAGLLKVGQPILWFSPPRRSNMMAFATISAATTSSVMACASTAVCGLMPTGRSRLGADGTYTTATIIVPTTGWPTSNSSLADAISPYTPAILQIVSAPLGGPMPSDRAEQAMRVCLATNGVRRLASVTSAGKLAEVYDLAVDHPLHAFIAAGGFIVHNCYDATRYFLMSRPPIAPKLPLQYASAEEAETARRWAKRVEKLTQSGNEVKPRGPWMPKKMVPV